MCPGPRSGVRSAFQLSVTDETCVMVCVLSLALQSGLRYGYGLTTVWVWHDDDGMSMT